MAESLWKRHLHQTRLGSPVHVVLVLTAGRVTVYLLPIFQTQPPHWSGPPNEYMYILFILRLVPPWPKNLSKNLSIICPLSEYLGNVVDVG